MNDGRNIHAEYLLGVTKPGTFIQDGLIRVSDLRDSKWFGLTVIVSEGNTHIINKRTESGHPVTSS